MDHGPRPLERGIRRDQAKLVLPSQYDTTDKLLGPALEPKAQH